MQLVYNQRFPVNVVLGNQKLGGAPYETADLLTEAEVLVVFPVRKSRQLERPSCAARVQDKYSGRIITIQGFNAVAYQIQALKPGEVISCSGKAKEFRGRTTFDIFPLVGSSSAFLDEIPDVAAGRFEPGEQIDPEQETKVLEAA